MRKASKVENERLEPVKSEWDDTTPKDTWSNYGATGRLAVLLAGVTFGAIFFPFEDTRWGLSIATLASYSVLVFGMAFRDENCSIGRTEVQEQLGKFLLMHVPFLLLVYAVEAEWLKLKLGMPFWLIQRGRKGSFYDWFLIASLCLIAWGQVHWMRMMVKRKLVSESQR